MIARRRCVFLWASKSPARICLHEPPKDSMNGISAKLQLEAVPSGPLALRARSGCGTSVLGGFEGDRGFSDFIALDECPSFGGI